MSVHPTSFPCQPQFQIVTPQAHEGQPRSAPPSDIFLNTSFGTAEPSRDQTRAVYAEEFAETIPEKYQRRAMLKAFSGWSILQVPNDGHSLFLSIAHALMDEHVLETLKSRAEELQRLVPPSELDILNSSIARAAKELEKYPNDAEKREVLQQFIRRLTVIADDQRADFPMAMKLTDLIALSQGGLRAKKGPREILSDQKISTGWILLLRNLSFGWWNKLCSEHPDDPRLKSFFLLGPHAESLPSALTLYRNEIASLKRAYPGGILEITALKNALGREISVIDVDPDERHSSPAKTSPHHLYVLSGLYSDHFDVLFHPKKIPPQILAEMKDKNRSFIPYSHLPITEDDEEEMEVVDDKGFTYDPWIDPGLFLGPVPTETLAQTLPQDHPCKAIQELKGCFIQRIFSDGHCLFQSLAVLLARPSVLDMLLARAEQLQRAAPPGVDLKALFTKTKELLNGGGSPGEILYSSYELSNNWVLFLRYLAMQYWADAFAKDPNSVQTFLASEKSQTHETDDDVVMAQYMTTICSYENPRWGDHTEIEAIQAVLGITITIVDLTTPRSQWTNGVLLSANPDPNHFYILLSPSPLHYDALLVPGQRN